MPDGLVSVNGGELEHLDDGVCPPGPLSVGGSSDLRYRQPQWAACTRPDTFDDLVLGFPAEVSGD